MEIVLDDFEIDACIKIKKYFVVMLNVFITINISMYINLVLSFVKCHVLSVVSPELFVRSWFFFSYGRVFRGLTYQHALHYTNSTVQNKVIVVDPGRGEREVEC